MARQRSGAGSAEASDADEAYDDSFDNGNASENSENEVDEETGRSAATDALWTDVRVQPIEIALPTGVGYTLRAYRMSTEVRAPEPHDDQDDDFAPDRSEHDEEELAEFDEEELTRQALAAGKGRRRRGSDDEAEDDDLDAEAEADTEVAADADADVSAEAETATEAEADSEADAEDEDEDEEADAESEEVPVFLSRDGRLLLFRDPEELVAFVRSGGDNDLAQLDSWDELRQRIEAEDVAPLDEDRYELDLVVENLRGGHDVWDTGLIIQAGEVARDIGYALHIQPIMKALAPGSPLDDLDEGLRTVEAGGFGAFLAKRRVRKIEAQTTAALGWRTIIGKISAAVDWRN